MLTGVSGRPMARDFAVEAPPLPPPPPIDCSTMPIASLPVVVIWWPLYRLTSPPVPALPPEPPTASEMLNATPAL